MINIYLTQIKINNVSAASSVNVGTTINIISREAQREQRGISPPPSELIQFPEQAPGRELQFPIHPPFAGHPPFTPGPPFAGHPPFTPGPPFAGHPPTPHRPG